MRPMLLLTLLGALLCGPALGATPAAPAMTGDTGIHDPSVIDVDGSWVSFQTGDEGGPYQGAIRLKTSPDGVAWSDAGAIGKGLPAWAERTLGFRTRNIWAPSISRRGDSFFLYYSISTFGKNTSAIGLMTNAAFDASKPDQGWVDRGAVLISSARDDFNAIDPFRVDSSDGRAFLSYGSFWSGIKLSELDPETGLLKAAGSPPIGIASRGRDAIEASSILEHDGKFYLFVSFDRCCVGISSTYRIMVGRADQVGGPYVAKDGTPMMKGGATELQRSAGRYIGPGGQEAFKTPEGEMLVYHYYDGDDLGRPKLQITPISWDADGWPQLAPPP